MITYPNQKVIHINKEETNNFLQIDKAAWMKASNELKYGTFKVYLYLAGNQDGFDLALSPKDIMARLDLSENTYHRAINELMEKNYLVINQGNIYNFYLYPQKGIYPCMGTYPQKGTVCTHGRVQDVPMDEYSMYPQMGREIDKIDKKDKIDNCARRKLRTLNSDELTNLLSDFNAGTADAELYEKYNLEDKQIDEHLPARVEIFTLYNKESTEPKDGAQIPLADGTMSDYYTSEFNITEENKPIYLSAMEHLFKFDMRFVNEMIG